VSSCFVYLFLSLQCPFMVGCLIKLQGLFNTEWRLALTLGWLFASKEEWRLHFNNNNDVCRPLSVYSLSSMNLY
jgi:hypothetical protein